MTDKSEKDQSDHKVDTPDDEIKKKRREALTKIVATAGIAHSMSGNWTKPVLESVVLPAHANTTLNCCEQGCDGPPCEPDCVPC